MTNKQNNDVWIIYSNSHDKKDSSASKMLDEAINQGLNAFLYYHQNFLIKDNELYYNNVLVTNLPLICFVRGHPFFLIKFLEDKNVRVVNNYYSTKTCRDKWETHKVVEKLKIAQPLTKLLKEKPYSYYLKLFKDNKFLIKSRYGSQGIDIHLINNELEYKEVIKNINNFNDYIVQQYMLNSYGKDVRCYIVGNKIIGYVLRKNDYDFKSNLALGGLSYHYKANEITDLNSLKIASKLQGEIISVDYLFKNDEELLFCEANTNAGFASYGYLGYDMRNEMIKYISKLVKLLSGKESS